MKKIALIIAGLLIHFSGFGQKGLFIGMYINDEKADTFIRVFMSYDSVKMVSNTWIRNYDMWLEAKCGTWVIKGLDPENRYLVTFLFNDGSSKDVIFSDTYLTRYQQGAPDFYTLHIDRMSFNKINGKGSIKERDIFNLKLLKEN